MEEKLTLVDTPQYSPFRLKRSVWLLVVILFASLIPLCLMLTGMDFSSMPLDDASRRSLIDTGNYSTPITTATVLRWLCVIIAMITAVMATLHYQLNNERSVLIIAFLFYLTAYLEIIYTLLNIRDSLRGTDVILMNKWCLQQTFFSLSLVLALTYILLNKTSEMLKGQFGMAAITCLLLVAYIAFYNAVINNSTYPPAMENSDALIKQPFAMTPLILLMSTTVYLLFRHMKTGGNIFRQALLLLCLLETIGAAYFVFGASKPHDSAYNIAHSLQLIAYLVPLSALFVDYFFSHRKALHIIEENHNQINQLAMYDPTTKLLNRSFFEITFDSVLANASRHRQYFALLFLDLDNFKLINDSIGHDTGDELLRQVAHRLQKSTRRGDYCARLGGDEFGIILPYIEHPSSVGLVARKLILDLSDSYTINNKRVYTSASMGIVIYPYGGNDYHSLLKNADIAMYRAKAMGRNTYEFYTPALSDQHFRQLDIESCL